MPAKVNVFARVCLTKPGRFVKIKREESKERTVRKAVILKPKRLTLLGTGLQAGKRCKGKPRQARKQSLALVFALASAFTLT